MNTDKVTTALGAGAAVFTAAAAWGFKPEVTGAIAAGCLGMLGFFTNKSTRKSVQLPPIVPNEQPSQEQP